MNNKNTLNDFLKIVEIWEKELDNYDTNQLTQKENAENWSIGQLYKHLIDGTLNFHLQQVNLCINSTENKSKKKNFKGFLAYNLLNGFPPIKIKVPASETYTPKEPESVDELKNGFQKLRQEMENVLENLKKDKKGKTAHPGFSYLNASEWYRLIPMHFKHHIRQKERIDNFLKSK
mgnify:CR=1 FL=1